MGWAKIDDKRWQHPKLRRAGLEASCLDYHAISYAAAMKTDGFIDENVAEMIAGVKHWRKLVARLVEVNRWERDSSGREGWWIHDYLDYNPSAAEIAAQQAAKSERARHAAVARWGRSDASGMQDASAEHPRSMQDASSKHASGMRAASAKQRRGNAPIPSRIRTKETNVSFVAEGGAAKPRKRDPLFDALAETCGLNLAEMTRPAASRVAAALATLRDLDPTPEDIRKRAETYRRLHPDWELTPTALAAHWPELTPGAIGREQRPSRFDGIDQLRAEALAKLALAGPPGKEPPPAEPDEFDDGSGERLENAPWDGVEGYLYPDGV